MLNLTRLHLGIAHESQFQLHRLTRHARHRAHADPPIARHECHSVHCLSRRDWLAAGHDVGGTDAVAAWVTRQLSSLRWLVSGISAVLSD